MSHSIQTSRRRFCTGLASAALLPGCGARSGPRLRSQQRQVSRQIAVLLPLSGPRAALGKKMAKSVWLAEDLGGAQRRVRVIDTGDDPGSAAGAASQAINDGADILVGPLFRDQTAAVLAAAGNVPVLSLSNDNSLAGQGAWVFGVTPAQSAQSVLRYAQESGAKRITMLDGGGALGTRARAALVAGSAGAGAVLLPSVARNTSPADMAAALRQAGGGSLPDIIYVPSAKAPELEQAVAAVATGVTTIGSLQWSGLPKPEFLRLDKACFTGPDPLRFDRLSSSYRAQLDEDMGVIGALAVDAVSVAQGAPSNGNLARVAAVDGLLGQTRFRSDKTCARALSVLRIEDGGVVRVA